MPALSAKGRKTPVRLRAGPKGKPGRTPGARPAPLGSAVGVGDSHPASSGHLAGQDTVAKSHAPSCHPACRPTVGAAGSSTQVSKGTVGLRLPIRARGSVPTRRPPRSALTPPHTQSPSPPPSHPAPSAHWGPAGAAQRVAGRGPQPAADWLPRLPDGEMEAAGGELAAGRLRRAPGWARAKLRGSQSTRGWVSWSSGPPATRSPALVPS